MVDVVEDNVAVQMDLGQLEEWAHSNLVKCKYDQRKVLHFRQNLMSVQLGSIFAEKDHRLLLNTNQQCDHVAMEANHIMGSTNKNVNSKLRGRD